MRAVHPGLLLLFTYLAVFLECRVEWLRNLIGVQIDILPPIIVYASLSTNFATVGLLAFSGGLLYDSLSANPLGVTVLPLLLTGLVLLWFRDLLLRDHPYARNMLGLFASLAVPAMTLILMLSLGQEPPLGWGTLWVFIILGGSGFLLTPLVFSVFDRLRNMFQYQVLETPGSFREDREIKRSRR
jgi:cell shape-determining protein MreD